MANRDQPQGFRPYGPILRQSIYVAAGAIYPGDAVMQESAGRVIVGAATNALIGVANSYASGAGVDVSVMDHPSQRFVGQMDETEVDAQTDLGLNYNLVATAGNSSYKQSRHELDSSTQNTTATLPFKALAINPDPANALGEFVDCICIINNHQLKGHTGTAGV